MGSFLTLIILISIAVIFKHAIVNSELQLLCTIPVQASSLTKDLFTLSWTSGVRQEKKTLRRKMERKGRKDEGNWE